MNSVTVLGLGRLGSAIAARLVDQGWTVSGWSRSGHLVPGVTPLAGPAGADLVLLCLFDGAACRQVLDQVDLQPDALVVNTSTVGPDEAAELAVLVDKRGGRLVHAPVMGSVGPARSGRLTVLAGGEEAAVATARPLLDVLGDVVPVGEVEDAAILKLVANGTLAAALLAARTGLAAGAGIETGRLLDVLQRSPVGGLLAAKRDRLLGTGSEAAADFTVAALAKDLHLLAGLTPEIGPTMAVVDDALAAGDVVPDDDVAALMRPPAARALDHGLTVAAGVTATDDVLAPLLAYARGHATGDPAHFGDAFWPTAHVEGVRDSAFSSWPLDEYVALFPGSPAPDEPARRRRIESVRTSGTVGTAEMTLRHGSDVFTDAFVLLRVDGTWRIANKVYHRHV